MTFASRKADFRITKQSRLIKNTSENYLRDDIWCGSPFCRRCTPENGGLSDDPQANVLIPSPNLLLFQPDWISNPTVTNVILFQTTLAILRADAPFLYYRARELAIEDHKHIYIFSNEHHRPTNVIKTEGKSQVHYNQEAIFAATIWYQSHLKKSNVIYLVNNDHEKAQAIEIGISPVQTVQEYCLALGDRELLDTLVLPTPSEEAELPPGTKSFFPAYLSKEVIHEKLGKNVFKGFLRQDRDNYLEAYVSSDAFDQDILILGSQSRNRALDGDTVYVELLPKSQWRYRSGIYLDVDVPIEKLRQVVEKNDTATQQLSDVDKPDSDEKVPTGVIVGISKRTSFRRYCGSIEIFKEEGKQIVYFDPIDLKMPKVELTTTRLNELEGKRIVVSVDSWPRTSRHPIGHYVKTIGITGDPSVESEALLIQHGISYEDFSPAVMACCPTSDWKITEQDLLVRKDLRNLRVCSIDPPGCTDIDDALHIRELPNGNFEMGVHIADVSHFIQEGSAIDREARNRGNTFYLVDRRIHMLPDILSGNICSLMEKVDRFAFSCIWELTPDAEIVDTTFCKSIIRSVGAHTYQQAQEKIDDLSRNDPLTQDLRNLNRLAKILRARRMKVGALELSSPAVKFVKDDENREFVDVELYELRETNALVEEYMLLANISTAKEILKFFPAFSMLRRHPFPRQKQFQGLIDIVQKHGMTIDISSSKALSESLNKAKKTDDPYFNDLVRILSTRCMMPAIYFSSGSVPQSEFFHFGLAAPIYTHFTSPIRRYAVIDVVVHRLLAASIGAAPLPVQITHENVQKTCNNINRRGRMADHASRDSTRLHTIGFFRGKKLTEKGRIIAVKANGCVVYVPRYGIEGKIYFSGPTQKQSLWTYDRAKQLIVSPDKKQSIKIFDEVTVQITLDEARKHAPKVVFTLVKISAVPSVPMDLEETVLVEPKKKRDREQIANNKKPSEPASKKKRRSNSAKQNTKK